MELIQRSADDPQSADWQALAGGRALLHCLSPSEERRRFFDAFAESTTTPAGLAGSLPISRPTVQRTPCVFADRGLAERDAGEYFPTTTGWLVCDTFRSLIADLAVISTRNNPLGQFSLNADIVPDVPRPSLRRFLQSQSVPSHSPQAPTNRCP